MMELKPCPVCGEPAGYSVITEKDGIPVTCDNTSCIMWPRYYTIEEWNTRPVEDEQAAEIASLRAELAQAQELGAIEQRWACHYHQQMERAREELAQARAACRGMVDYRDRVGPLNFQLEKADDFIRLMRLAIEEAG